MRDESSAINFFRVRDFECVGAQDPEKLGQNYLMLFTQNNENAGHVLWVDDEMGEADEPAKTLDQLQNWIDIKMTE